jgi:hypothetical protein
MVFIAMFLLKMLKILANFPAIVDSVTKMHRLQRNPMT